MSHRVKRFAEVAIFAWFYLFAAMDSILGFYRHQIDTKIAHCNYENKSTR
jgi:hypothetical protein